MQERSADEVRKMVREHYGAVAQSAGAQSAVAEKDATAGKGAAKAGSCCAPSCCGGSASTAKDASLALGYAEEDLDAVPEGANLGLGCGNPQAIAALREGETVLDLGSGGGFDCLLAAARVGPKGRVIGVDMTPEMITRARDNVRRAGHANIEIRLGEIEHLPVADASVDVILSNCVINLSPDKQAVFRDTLRVLRPGGRLAISDVVSLKPLPEQLRTMAAALTGCVAGAAPVGEIEQILHDLGYEDVRVTVRPESREVIRSWYPGAEEYVASATIEARKAGARA
ncbi:MAG: arsenite methyltransferase [Sandaracinaceae bacterium]|nr:arsenite methyltransferase [Sandaracinaceae bacterium]